MKHSARLHAINNAIAHNKYLPKWWLRRKTNEELICFVHPDRREEIYKQLGIPMDKPLTTNFK